MRLDYSTLTTLSATLANLFWGDLERHHPGHRLFAPLE